MKDNLSQSRVEYYSVHFLLSVSFKPSTETLQVNEYNAFFVDL